MRIRLVPFVLPPCSTNRCKLSPFAVQCPAVRSGVRLMCKRTGNDHDNVPMQNRCAIARRRVFTVQSTTTKSPRSTASFAALPAVFIRRTAICFHPLPEYLLHYCICIFPSISHPSHRRRHVRSHGSQRNLPATQTHKLRSLAERL